MQSFWVVQITYRTADGGTALIGPYYAVADCEQMAFRRVEAFLPRRCRNVVEKTVEPWCSPWVAPPPPPPSPEVVEIREFMEAAREDQRDAHHHDKIGVRKVPEPKSIYAPAAMSRISTIRKPWKPWTRRTSEIPTVKGW